MSSTSLPERKLTTRSSPPLQRIKSQRTRNLLRGLIARDFDETAAATFDNMRRSVTADDAEMVAGVILTNPLFKNFPLPSPFPTQPQIFARYTHRPVTQGLFQELAFQCARIKINSENIAHSLIELRAINDAILDDDSDRSTNLIRNFIERRGYSLVVLGKLAYLKARFGSDPNIVSFVDAELNKFGLANRGVVSIGAIDMMENAYPFIALRKNILDFSRTKRFSDLTNDIVNWQFQPIKHTRTELSSALLSLGLSSVLDASVFILVHHRNLGLFAKHDLENYLNDVLPREVVQAWDAISSDPCPSARMTFEESDPGFDDFKFYRRSIAWIEYQSVSKFRMAADPFYIERPIDVVAPAAVEAARELFANVEAFSNLSEPVNYGPVEISRFDVARSGTFFRTLAFVYLLRSGTRASNLSSTQLLSLLNTTTDISRLVHIGEVRDFFAQVQRDRLSHYLGCAVVSECSGLSVDEHRLRRALQDLVIRDYGGDIVSLASFFGREAQHVANHMFETCSEEFLTQLFILFSDADSVFEARAQLLDWYARTFDEPTVAERAKTLRLDQKLRKVRGEIDDTRIYVDPLRFRQWIEDNYLEELSSILRTSVIDHAELAKFTAFGDFTEDRIPHVRLARVLQACFREFCENKRYGVASYLGRRIRHGTLKGHLSSQLDSIIQKSKYECILQSTAAGELIRGWKEQYDNRIDLWGAETFHIFSKSKSHGMIYADVTDSKKIEVTRNAIRSLEETYRATGNLGNVVQAIAEWCWLLIDKDLGQIRLTVEAARAEWGSLDVRELRKFCDTSNAHIAGELCREINIMTEERFRTLARWFSKPAVLSPSAQISILVDAVTDEVHDIFPNFTPSIEKTGIPDLELFGMQYHHAYDFLYVVIYNAAKHGDRAGKLVQDIRLDREDGGTGVLSITITSDLTSGDSIVDARRRIEEAMSGSSDDAMIVDRRSGIKKLMRLKADVKEVVDIGIMYGERTVSFTYVVRLPVN